VLCLIWTAAGTFASPALVASPTSNSTHPTSSPTSSPTRSPLSSAPTSNRLLETTGLNHHCQIPEYFRSDCDDHNILTGTECRIWFGCPEDKFPKAVSQTCQENGEWTGEDLIPDCEADHCPILAGFQMYETGGCEGRNEGGITFESLEQCWWRCETDTTCVSFEYAKPLPTQQEPNRCSISTSCTHDESEQRLRSDTCFYAKDEDVARDGLTPHSNNEGVNTFDTHCPLDDDIHKHYTTSCDGTILANTRCDFSFRCKERQTSKSVTQTCQQDGTWKGNILEGGQEESLDPNCYETPEPSHLPTQQPFSLHFTTEEYICSQACPNSLSCRVCRDKEVTPTPCINAIECDVRSERATTKYVEESRCVSYGMTQEICHETGGDFIVNLQACVSWSTEKERCTTKGGEIGFTFSAGQKYRPGQKACRLVYGFMCDEDSGLRPGDLVTIVDEDQSCPSIQHWDLSCDLLAESNEVIPAPKKPSSNGGGECLGSDSHISLPDGTTQLIYDLQVGTNVALGNDAQSTIVFFSHFDRTPEMKNVVTISTQETNITATPNHLIYSSENEHVTLSPFNLRAFEEVKVGDYILMDSESGPVSTKVTNIIANRILTRVFNAVARSGYLIANNIFVASGVAFGVLPNSLQYPVVHAVSMLICGMSERVCDIEENDTKPKWVRTIQGWFTAMDLNDASSTMALTRSYVN